jgi:hypothetical protein
VRCVVDRYSLTPSVREKRGPHDPALARADTAAHVSDMPSPTVFFDAFGWVGAACVVIPYALVVTGRLAGTTTTYRAANIAGGVLLMLNTWYHAAYPSAAVNVVWIVIGVYAMTRRRAIP